MASQKRPNCGVALGAFCIAISLDVFVPDHFN